MHPQDRLFCEIAIQLQLLTREQVTRCVQVQAREGAGQSIATIAAALGYMDQPAVDSVLHQQQRVLERRREAREASRAQREAESRAAAGLTKTAATAQSRAQRVGASSYPSETSGSGRQRDATPSPAGPGRSPDKPRRQHGSWSEARQSADDQPDVRDTVDERPPAVRGYGRSRAASGAIGQAVTAPLPRSQQSQAESAAAVSFEELVADDALGFVSSPPAVRGALLTGARGTLLESSGMEQKRRELAQPHGPSSRPVPSVRDWRNPSQPPPPTAGLDVASPVPQHARRARSTRPPPNAASRGSLRAPALDGPHYVDRALDLCAKFGASDFHLHSGAAPRIRIDGALQVVSADEPVSASAAARIVDDVLDDAERMQLALDGELRCSYTSPSSGIRARLQVLTSEHGLHLHLHVLPSEVPSAAPLGLGEVLRALRDRPSGLCICSGPAGSGTTTTLWSLAQSLAAERARHVVSLESPLELDLHAGVGLFEQREVGLHVDSYAAGIEWALSEGADVIVVADLLAPSAFEASLRTSSARCLVLGGLRCNSAVAALRRLLCDTPGDPEALRSRLADSLRVLLHQRLVPRLNPPGCTAAFEALFGSERVAQLIRAGDLARVAALLDEPSEDGHVSLRDALAALVRSSTIGQDAMARAAGVDRHFLER